MIRRTRRTLKPLMDRFQTELREQIRNKSWFNCIRYDFGNDMLHVWVAKSADTITLGEAKGVFIDYDPKSKRIVGIVVLGFETNILPVIGDEDLRENWVKLRKWFRRLSWIEAFVAFFGIDLETIANERAKRTAEKTAEWFATNPRSLELASAIAAA